MVGTAPFVLTHRDTAILLAVYSYGGCRADHLKHFFPPTTRTALYRRVAKLVDAGYLASRRLPPMAGIGSGPAFLMVGPKARSVLAQALDLSRAELARIRLEAPSVINHHLSLVDVRLSIERATTQPTVFQLVDWQGDGELVLRVQDPKTKIAAAIVPDATFTLARADGVEQTFYLELDMGTMPRKRMKARLRAYLLHAQSEQAPVLFVVSDAQRQAAIARWAAEEAQALGTDPTIFWLTVKARLTEETVITAPIWRVVGGPQRFALADLASDEATRRDSTTEAPALVGGTR